MFSPGEIDLFVSGPVFFGILREETFVKGGKKNIKRVLNQVDLQDKRLRFATTRNSVVGSSSIIKAPY